MILISEDDSGMRLDRFLRSLLPTIKLSRIQQALRLGEIRVNKRRCKPSTRINTADQLRLPPQFVSALSENQTKKHVDSISVVCIETHIPIIYRDEGIIVVDKPSGIACHGGSGTSFGVIETMRKLTNEDKLELVHRIDKETSGIVVLARKRSVLRELHKQLREDSVDKQYLAIVYGVWNPKRTKIELPLFKFENEQKVHKVIVSKRGKPSTTHVHLIKQNNGFSLVRVKPKTGRTHQIRVHLASAGNPIVGDSRYAKFINNRELLKNTRDKKMNRMFLHANKIGFIHPLSNKHINFVSEMPQIFSKLIFN